MNLLQLPVSLCLTQILIFLSLITPKENMEAAASSRSVGCCSLAAVKAEPGVTHVVIGGAEQVPAQVGVPGQAVTFLLVAFEPQVRAALPAGVGLGGVLGVVEHQNVRGGGFGGDDAGVLGHVASPVHLSVVVDLDFNLNFPAHRTKPSKL